jgi:hypothetical protein
MENWERRFDRVQPPDSSVPSHREELRKKLQSDRIPAGHSRRAMAAFGLAALVTLGALTLGYPSWAKDLWNTVAVKTIMFRTKDGMRVVIRKMGPDAQCSMPCDTQMQMCEVGGRRAIMFKKCLNPAEMKGDSFSISTEAVLKQFNLGSDEVQKITISTPDGENIWIVNGDTIDEKSVSKTIERLSEENAEALERNPCGLKNLPPDQDVQSAANAAFELQPNYPNPFNPTTQISFDLKKSGLATLKVYNLMGQEVATLLNGYTDAGHHTVTFNGANLPSGSYLYTLQTGGTQMSKMMVLAK